MKEQCFDEGAIQAFLDGELASDKLETIARHVALCDDCSLLLQETEEESAFAFAALDGEFNTLIPTERIRTNLYQAISEIEKPKVSLWEKITGLGFIFSSPSITAFAGLIIVVGIFAVVWKFNNGKSVSPVETAQIVTSNQPQSTGTNIIPTSEIVRQNPAVTLPVNVNPKIDLTKAQTAKAGNADSQPKYQNLKYTVESPKQRTAEQKPTAAPAELLSGEATYVKTIATLNKTVDGSKDVILTPSARVAFEKDLAMVNDAITKMKTEVRKNPKNEVAKEVLRSSYQNKIDLLNSVAERNDLVAGLD